METEKIVVILLLVTVILSIASVAVTFSLKMPDRIPQPQQQIIKGTSYSSNSGNVKLTLTSPDGRTQ